ncbi:MAG TPA: biotin-dependent carboxyltransferase family protein [Aliidongia sp.]|uniref:5-oxoprolinase subunit C family protein n=1 Tax=Aliidongia sp. TaxID=1914230 RepID=UPI002DDCA2DA|nr:biotin-dependent carboxyltransferase family protein [Aliidongia sp.]HEV2675246.1 biotin-dependent carboxyltransferase family protein [Aliidongia sp.]
MSHLTVDRPGLSTTVQDLGRRGLQRYGVPVSGALDPLALRLANALVGNPAGTAALEILALGPTLTVEAESVRVALVGSAVGLMIDGHPVPSGQSVTVLRGARISVGGFTDAASAILAIEGGFELASCMGSLSTYGRGGFGGFAGRALKPGDAVALAKAAATTAPERKAEPIDYGSGPIRVVLGPQDDWFEPAAIERFFAEPYIVTAEADRMGMRLEGARLAHARGFNIVSDGIAPGHIQVPGTGQPIVLLADRQTVGGYPKIGAVIGADLPRLGRMRPGDMLRFARIEVAEAEAVRRAQETTFAALVQRIGPVIVVPTTEQLLAVNLIDGVVAA